MDVLIEEVNDLSWRAGICGDDMEEKAEKILNKQEEPFEDGGLKVSRMKEKYVDGNDKPRDMMDNMLKDQHIWDFTLTMKA